MSTKVKLNIVVTNNGDGSVGLHFFKNNKLAQAYHESESEPADEGVHEFDLEFDENGDLLDKYCTDVKEYLIEQIEYMRQFSVPNANTHRKIKEYEKLLAELDE